MDFSPGGIAAGIIFGAVGFGAWRFGRQQQSVRHMLIGGALMALPLLLPSGLPVWLGGCVLTVLCFWP